MVGLLCAQLGAQTTIITDKDDAAILALADRNAAECQRSGAGLSSSAAVAATARTASMNNQRIIVCAMPWGETLLVQVGDRDWNKHKRTNKQTNWRSSTSKICNARSDGAVAVLIIPTFLSSLSTFRCRNITAENRLHLWMEFRHCVDVTGVPTTPGSRLRVRPG